MVKTNKSLEETRYHLVGSKKLYLILYIHTVTTWQPCSVKHGGKEFTHLFSRTERGPKSCLDNKLKLRQNHSPLTQTVLLNPQIEWEVHSIAGGKSEDS